MTYVTTTWRWGLVVDRPMALLFSYDVLMDDQCQSVEDKPPVRRIKGQRITAHPEIKQQTHHHPQQHSIVTQNNDTYNLRVRLRVVQTRVIANIRGCSLTTYNMFFNSKTIALLSALSTVSLASDVYSHFNDASGSQIGTTNFDIGNPGCFSVPDAFGVSFTQAGGTHTADGPYCLYAYTAGGCSGDPSGTQQFANVELNDGKDYALDDGLAAEGSYRWDTDSC